MVVVKILETASFLEQENSRQIVIVADRMRLVWWLCSCYLGASANIDDEWCGGYSPMLHSHWQPPR
jgi:hypothetical protein